MADFVIAKKVNGQVVHFFPKTRSDLVMYGTQKTVSDKIDEMLREMQEIKNVLSMDISYLTDAEGNKLTDANGNYLISVSKDSALSSIIKEDGAT